jgi:hypothetical protein
MARTRVFISYCNEDWQWFDRLRKHLAVLERENLIDVWSDRRIGVGDQWLDKIEKALTNAKIAILILTPGFMASKFIWDEEMPRIEAHQKNGMLILPIRAEPCAWTLEQVLAPIEARPKGDLPLSAYSNVEIDAELTAFAYEMHARLSNGSSDVVEQQLAVINRLRLSLERRAIGPSSAFMERRETDGSGILMPMLSRVWSGEYPASATKLSLTITRVTGSDFEGELDYVEQATKTRIAGFATAHRTAIMESALWNDLKAIGPQAAICFAEQEYLAQGRKKVDFNGVYRGILQNDAIAGGWYKQGNLVGHFSLRAAPV